MPAKNIHHDVVIEALKADGWTITHDPYRLSYGGRPLYVDLGAERASIAAEKDDRRIAVEVQSFLGRSPVRALQEALGQYEMYRIVLNRHEPERQLYMAVEEEVYDDIFSEQLGRLVVAETKMKLIAFDPVVGRITKWIS